MGTNTHVQIRLLINHAKISEEYIQVFKHLEKGGMDNLKNKPNHPFFECERWFMLKPESYDIINESINYDEYLYYDCEYKDYDNELIKFIDWIISICDQCEGDFVGIREDDGEGWMRPVYIKKLGDYDYL